MGKCQTCKFWESEGQSHTSAIEAKRCKYAIHTEDAMEWDADYHRALKPEFKETKAFVIDASGYYAAFYTKADFACNQYQEKDA